jgi:hypothetical protein
MDFIHDLESVVPYYRSHFWLLAMKTQRFQRGLSSTHTVKKSLYFKLFRATAEEVITKNTQWQSH